jgi:hypothetical protein
MQLSPQPNKKDMPQYDLMDIDDVLESYPELSAGQRLTLKLGCATNEQQTRQHLEPMFSASLRALRQQSIKESALNASLLAR